MATPEVCTTWSPPTFQAPQEQAFLYKGGVCHKGDPSWGLTVGVCSRINPAWCQIGNVGGIKTELANPNKPVADKNIDMRCTYDACQVANADRASINEWVAKYGQNDFWAKEIMPRWCSKQETTCPPGTDGKPMAQCSRFISTSDNGIYCTAWALSHPNEADAAKYQYCNLYNTPDCMCINRKLYKEYNAVQNQTPLKDPCWWKPCQMANTNLVTTAQMNVDCPTTLCQQIVNTLETKNIDVNNSPFYQACQGNSGNGDSESNGPPPTEAEKKRRLYIIIALVVAGLLILAAAAAAAAWYFYRKRKSVSTTTTSTLTARASTSPSVTTDMPRPLQANPPVIDNRSIH